MKSTGVGDSVKSPTAKAAGAKSPRKKARRARKKCTEDFG
jgi:hypothetical protein